MLISITEGSMLASPQRAAAERWNARVRVPPHRHAASNDCSHDLATPVVDVNLRMNAVPVATLQLPVNSAGRHPCVESLPTRNQSILRQCEGATLALVVFVLHALSKAQGCDNCTAFLGHESD